MSGSNKEQIHAPELSRRGFMLSGTAMALAANTADDDALAAPLQNERPPGLVWESAVGEPLDPRVILVESRGVAVVATGTFNSDTRQVYGLDTETGEQRWEMESSPFNGLYHHDGMLYEHDMEVFGARDPVSSEGQWAASGRFTPPFAFDGAYGAFSGQYHPATVVDLDDETTWQVSDETLHEVVTLHDSTVVVHGEGTLAAYDTDSREERWRVSGLPEGRFTVSATGTWPLAFVTAPDRTIAISLDSGERRFTREQRVTPGYFSTGSGEGVVLATADGTLFALNPVDGAELWETELTEDGLAIYEVGGGVALPVTDDQLWSVALNDGSVEWSVELTTAVPFVEATGETVYTGDSTQRGLDGNGQQRWAYEAAGTRPLVPAIGSERMLIAAGDTVYGFAFDGAEPTPTATLGTSGGGTEDGAEPSDEQTDTGTPSNQTTPQEDPESLDGSGPGFGAAAGVLSVLGVAELLRRQSGDDDA